MKLFFIFIFFLIGTSGFAQTYFPFHNNRPAYYNFNSYEIFYSQAAIAIDSLEISGSDTTFFHSPIIDWDNSVPYCYMKAHDTSFVGKRSIRTANGYDEFLNRDGDTVYFKNNSVLNDSWTMLNLGGGNKIVATVQSIMNYNILGTNDSIKKISVQAKDSLGNNISNIFNGKIFKIGKSNGFVSGYSLFHFPDDTIGFSIIGIENPLLGLNTSQLSPANIFDFDVGDRFDYSFDHGFEPTTHNSYRETDKILSKTVSADGDTVSYQVSFMNWSFGNSWYDTYDTILSGIKTWTFVLPSYEFLLSKPFQIPINGTQTDYLLLTEAFYNSSLPVLQNQPDYFFINGDCLNGTVADNYFHDSYGAGLGEVMSFSGDGGMGDWTFYSLVYFNKNGIEWGDSLNWSVITGNENPNDLKTVCAFPNPAHDMIFLSGNFSSPTEIHLLNLFGEEMKKIKITQLTSQVIIDVANLPDGVYLIKINSGEKTFTQKIVKD